MSDDEETEEEYPPEPQTVSVCRDCAAPLTVNQCCPRAPSRPWSEVDLGIKYCCEKCWIEREAKMLNNLGKGAAKIKKKKPATTVSKKKRAAKPKKRKAAAPVTPPKTKADTKVDTPTLPSAKPTYQIGALVNVKWTNGMYYAAHITNHTKEGYDVYFLDDAMTLSGVGEHEVRAPLTSGGKQGRNRNDYIGLCFQDDGDDKFRRGKFKVASVKDNMYMCTRVSGGTKKMIGTVNAFDVGVVIRQVELENDRSTRTSSIVV